MSNATRGVKHSPSARVETDVSNTRAERGIMMGVLKVLFGTIVGLALLVPAAIILGVFGLPAVVILAVLAVPVLVVLAVLGLPILLVLIAAAAVLGVAVACSKSTQRTMRIAARSERRKATGWRRKLRPVLR